MLGLLATHAAVGVANARAYAHQREAAAHAASRAAELEALLESMTDGVLLVDEAGQVTSANRAAATILGRSRGEPGAGALPDGAGGLRATDGAPIWPTAGRPRWQRRFARTGRA